MAVFLIPSFSTAIPIRINGILYYTIFYSVVFVAFRLATPQTLFVLLRLQSRLVWRAIMLSRGSRSQSPVSP